MTKNQTEPNKTLEPCSYAKETQLGLKQAIIQYQLKEFRFFKVHLGNNKSSTWSSVSDS